MRKILIVSFFLLNFVQISSASSDKEPIAWQGWSEHLFEQASKDKKFVILDLEAVWCHWCHVMAETTYRDAKVVKLINDQFIPVRVDQDANPDLSLRYEKWGWPATIIFNRDGSEIVKLRGYIEPRRMASLLQEIIQDPTPGPSVQSELKIKSSQHALLSKELINYLENEHLDLYDQEFGGWGTRLKSIDSDSLEYAMVKAVRGDKTEEKKALVTLNQALNLLDRQWGGFYQYSDERNWKSPHYEKIMSIQSQYIRLYVLGYGIWKRRQYLEAAQKTAEYVLNFWKSPEGAFYTSQDADIDAKFNGKRFYSLKDRRRQRLRRMPRIDQHIYSRENGWMISSLASLYDRTGEQEYLDSAQRAAKWILENRSLAQGGFRHDAEDPRGPYLGDTLAMGQAFLNLYASTADRKWLSFSEKCALFIQKNFRHKEGGYISAVILKDAVGVFQKPVLQIDENVSMARWTNLLSRYTGKDEYKKMAEHTMRFLASSNIVQSRPFLTGLLLADLELASDPVHITVVGAKDDPTAKALYRTALHCPSSYRRIEWWDRKEGLLPNPDVAYPEMKEVAAFFCENKACSLPVFTPQELEKTIRKKKFAAEASKV